MALLSLSLTACGTMQDVPVNPAFFSGGAIGTCEARGPGRVALFVPQNVQETTGEPRRRLRLKVGHIAEHAVLVALRACFEGGANQVVELPQGGGYSATLVINAVHYEADDRLLWAIPIPPLFIVGLSQHEFSAKLTLDMTLLDAQGNAIWTRHHADEAGHLTWSIPSSEDEPLADGIVRLGHEAAWRLALDAVRDVRQWVDAQRMQPRDL